VISIANPLLGLFRYLVLSVPDGWTLRKGEIASEIGSSIEYNGFRWVIDGEAHHYILNLTGEDAYSLDLKCYSGRRPDSRIMDKLRHPMTGSGNVSGHTFTYGIGEKDIGFFVKKPTRCIRINFVCEETNRGIRIELLGRGSSSGVMSLIESFERSRCHS